MKNQIIGVTPQKFGHVNDLAKFLASEVNADPNYHRSMARLGITEDGQILLETTKTPLTIDNKSGATVLQLAEPTQQCRVWITAIQRVGRRTLATASSVEIEKFNQSAKLTQMIAATFQDATDRVVFAPGAATTEERTYYYSKKGLTRVHAEGKQNIVAVPEQLGNGIVALSSKEQDSKKLYHLGQSHVKIGEFGNNKWTPVFTANEPIKAIERRFRDQYLIATLASGRLVVLDCSSIRKGSVTEVQRSSDCYHARPNMTLSGTSVGLFTMGGNATTPPTTLFAGVDNYGLPTATAQQLQVAQA
ncbi:MAG: hypothetical protein Q7S48_01955 [bacterium]|nr:hypothetical protein [bacterium]